VIAHGMLQPGETPEAQSFQVHTVIGAARGRHARMLAHDGSPGPHRRSRA